MKYVMLASSLGAKISEETQSRPKPMVQIGRNPSLWHILKLYSAHGVNDFVICCGFMGYMIKNCFASYFLHISDVSSDMSNNRMDVHHKNAEPWKVTLVDTGENKLTGGRLNRVAKCFEGDEAFCFTYGDGLSDLDIAASIRFHKSHGRVATVTAVRPPGRNGAIECDEALVTAFTEKPPRDGGMINGGYFVLSPKCLEFIEGDGTSWEGKPLADLAARGEIMAFEHEGFWQLKCN